MRTFKKCLTDRLDQFTDPVLEEMDEDVFLDTIGKLKKKFPHWDERMLESWAAVFTMANVDDFDLTPEGQYEEDELEIPLFTAQFIYCYGS